MTIDTFQNQMGIIFEKKWICLRRNGHGVSGEMTMVLQETWLCFRRNDHGVSGAMTITIQMTMMFEEKWPWCCRRDDHEVAPDRRHFKTQFSIIRLIFSATFGKTGCKVTSSKPVSAQTSVVLLLHHHGNTHFFFLVLSSIDQEQSHCSNIHGAISTSENF